MEALTNLNAPLRLNFGWNARRYSSAIVSCSAAVKIQVTKEGMPPFVTFIPRTGGYAWIPVIRGAELTVFSREVLEVSVYINYLGGDRGTMPMS